MPVILRNKDTSIEIDIHANLKYEVSKGAFDVIYEDTGATASTPAHVYVVLRSKAITENSIKLDWRECTVMPGETGFTSAEELRDTLLAWNIPVYGIKAFRDSDETYQSVRLDQVTNGLLTVDQEHHEIHDGNHFFYTDSVILASQGIQDYLITTPDTAKWIHMVFSATGSAITQVLIYEVADRTGTAQQVIFNNNRNSSTLPGVTVHKGTSGGTTDGTLIWQMKSGSATNQSRAGLTAERSSEIILKRNTKYIIRIYSGTADNLTNLQLEWYEHTSIF